MYLRKVSTYLRVDLQLPIVAVIWIHEAKQVFAIYLGSHLPRQNTLYKEHDERWRFNSPFFDSMLVSSAVGKLTPDGLDDFA
jgi:hypothetical protein